VSPWTASLLSVLAVCLVSLVGVGTLSCSTARLRRLAAMLVSFAVGTLLGDAFIHLLPEAFAGGERPLGTSLLVLGGILVFFVVEKLLRHHHGPLHDHHHERPGERARPELAAINVIGDAVHNFIDGVLIGASYLVTPALGLSTTIAVLFHEIPQELGDFGVLVHSGLSVRKAVLLNLASASTAVLGTVMALAAGSLAGETVTSVLVPMAAGGFVYIAGADLIPELQHDRSLSSLLLQSGFIAAGIAVMAALTLLD
jgi:zinc and cadmium transporter